MGHLQQQTEALEQGLEAAPAQLLEEEQKWMPQAPLKGYNEEDVKCIEEGCDMLDNHTASRPHHR